MNEQKVANNHKVFHPLLSGIWNFLRTPVGGKDRLMIGRLLTLMLGINGMDITNRFFGRQP